MNDDLVVTTPLINRCPLPQFGHRHINLGRKIFWALRQIFTHSAFLAATALWSAQGSPSVVDYHVHYFSPEVVAAIEGNGFDFSGSDYQFAVGRDFYEVDRILDNNEATKMVLLSGGFNYHFDDPAQERKAVERENDRLAAAVAADRDRLYGFCGLDPLEEWALHEAERCVHDLGLHGVKLHLPISGVDLARPDHVTRMETFLGFCAANEIPVLVHNSTDSLPGNEYAGVFIDAFLDESEPLTVVFAHAGGASSFGEFTVEFLDLFAESFQSGRIPRRHQIYFELSAFLAPERIGSDRSIPELRRLVTEIGASRFLFGSDYPMRSSERYLEELSAQLELDPGILAGILRRDLFAEPDG